MKKLYLLLMALFLAMSANAAMYLHYDDGSDGWNNSIPQMNQSGNTYTYTLRTSGNVYFIISKSNSTDWGIFRAGNNFYYAGGADDQYNVTSGSRFRVDPYNSGSKTMYISHSYAVANITFKLETGSPDYMTVTVEPAPIYVTGQVAGGWYPGNPNEVSYTPGVGYVIEGTGGQYFTISTTKSSSDSWDTGIKTGRKGTNNGSDAELVEGSNDLISTPNNSMIFPGSGTWYAIVNENMSSLTLQRNDPTVINDYTVYFTNPNNYSTPYAYAWDGGLSSSQISSMTYNNTLGLWEITYTLTSAPDYILFKDNGGTGANDWTNKTQDYNFVNGAVYTGAATDSSNKNNPEYASLAAYQEATTVHEYTIQFDNTATQWGNVYVKVDDNDYTAMTASGNIYSYTYSSTSAPSNVTFASSDQGANALPQKSYASGTTYTPNKYNVKFDNSGSQWSTVKVKFDSGSYVNMSEGSNNEWTASTIAWSKPDKVSFSNASGASTLENQDFTNNNTYVGPTRITITSIKLLEKESNTEKGTFTKVSDTQWICKKFTPNVPGSNNVTANNMRYRLVVHYSDNSSAQYVQSIDKNNQEYWLAASETPYNMTTGGTGYFVFNNSSFTGESATITVNVTDATKPEVSSMKLQVYTTPIEELVNMPLKPADFAGGQKHYFLVGSTQGAWRLQPEWEFTVSEDGTTATLPARLYYQGLFAIGVVDNFEDYAYHRYKLYTFNSNDQKEVNADVNSIQLGSTPRNAHGFIYTGNDSDNDFFGVNNCMLFTVDYASLTEETLKSCKPKLAMSTTLNLDASGNPTNVSFDLTHKNDYADYMVFQFVGSDLRWDNIELNAPMQRRVDPDNRFWNTVGWEQAWIQYDEEGNPYIDANGDYMYQTVYKPEWFKKHPTLFWNSNVDTENGGFYYDSSALTFINVDSEEFDKDDPYWSFYKHHANNVVDKFGGSVVVSSSDDASMFYNYTEKLITPELEGEGENAHVKYTYTTAGRSANWECYVAKDVWLQGDFKIWSGFGGNSILYQPVSGMTSKNPQYYSINGGHSIYDTKVDVSGYDITTKDADVAMGYAMNEDVFGANFNVGSTPKYFKRVVLWYDPEGGFNNSVVQFIVEKYGPNIKATRATRSAIDGGGFSANCSWNIPDAGSNTETNVTNYVINRYRVVNGEYVIDKKDVFAGTPNCTVGALGTITNNGTAKLPSGRYVYEVVVTFTDSDGTYEKSAFSNVVTIYNATSPLTASANQVTQTVSGAKKYTFDLAVTLDLAEATKGLVVPSEADEEILVPVSNFINNYTIAPADASKANIATASAVTVTCNGLAVSGVTTNASTGEITIPFQGASKSKVVVTYKDLPKGEYTFSANVTPKSGYAATNWATLNYQDTEVDGTIIVPDAVFSIGNFTLSQVDNTNISDLTQKKYLAANQLPTGAYKKAYEIENDWAGELEEDEEPVIFHQFNMLSATVTVNTKLTDATLAKWNVSGATIANTAAESGVYNNIDLNNATETVDGLFVNVGNGNVCANQTYRFAAPSNMITYSRKDNVVENTAKVAPVTKSYEIAERIVEPTFSDDDINGTHDAVRLIKNKMYLYKPNTNSYDEFYQIDAALTFNHVIEANDLVGYAGYSIEVTNRNLDVPVALDTKSKSHGNIIHSGWRTSDVNTLPGYEVYDYNTAYNDDKHNWSALVAKPNSDLVLHIEAIATTATNPTSESAIQNIVKDVAVAVTPFAHYPFLYSKPVSVPQSKRQHAPAAESVEYKMIVPTSSATPISYAMKAGTTTGVESIAVEASGDAVYYTIQGIRVDSENLRPGIYVEVRGNQARKIMVK